MVPPLFFLTMFLLAILGAWLRQPVVALALPAVYATVLAGIGLSLIPRKGPIVAALVPVALATMHVAYAVGFFYGLFCLVFRPSAWDSGSMSSLSR
jgi:hypothetical protein